LAQEVSPRTYINVMGQYRPAYRAADHPPLSRPVTSAEVRRAEAMARTAGLDRLDQRVIPRGLIWVVE
jgi:putative pyruvate formate lyase activating enzyme